MHTFLLSAENWYLVCFGVGLVLSVLAFVGGFGHLHFGHLHLGHFHLGHAHAGHRTRMRRMARHDSSLSPLNGFTLHRLPLLVWRSGLSAVPFQLALGHGRLCAGSPQRARRRRHHLLVSRAGAAASRACAPRGRHGDDRRARARLEPHSRGWHRARSLTRRAVHAALLLHAAMPAHRLRAMSKLSCCAMSAASPMYGRGRSWRVRRSPDGRLRHHRGASALREPAAPSTARDGAGHRSTAGFTLFAR